ncbi:hypothetical protein QQ045_008128 [Rhodiola kirilowii]
MKMCFFFCSGMNIILLLLIFVFMIPSVSMSLRSLDHFTQSADRHQANNGGYHGGRKNEANKQQTHEDGKEKIRGIKTAGSRLPDCTHACGSCMPCRLVIVGSANCAISLTEAESCPISYRCMCNNKTYPVP